MTKFNIQPDELYHAIKKFQEFGCGSVYFENTDYNGRILELRSTPCINFANCSYMGLESHPAVIEGAKNALLHFGSQISMSRSLISSPLFAEIEKSLASIFGGFPIVYNSTTMAHYAAMPMLIKENDAIILDAYVHNSVRTASEICKSRGTFVLVSKHNDMEHLRYLIKRLKKEGYKNIWYCADGIYSMHGDVCNVKDLQQLLNEEENFFAYVDDAHGVGWCGKNGSGYVIGNFGLHEKMIVAGSLSKSFATSGGFLIVPDQLLADYLKLTGHSYIFSAPIPPSSLGAINASLKLHFTPETEEFQKEVNNLIIYFKTSCEENDIAVYSKCHTPIHLIKVGSKEQILKIQHHLVQSGFFASVAAHPAVSVEDGGIRVSISRNITKSDIDNFLFSLKQVYQPNKKVYEPEN